MSVLPVSTIYLSICLKENTIFTRNNQYLLEAFFFGHSANKNYIYTNEMILFVILLVLWFPGELQFESEILEKFEI